MKDPIERQDVIDLLSGIYHYMGSWLVQYIEDGILSISPVQQGQRWIPCGERLPEDDTEVLVYLFDRPSPYIAWVCDGCWFTEDFQVEKENYPNTWMPLPEPYRGEGET